MYTKISVYLLAALLAATGFELATADYHHGDLVPSINAHLADAETGEPVRPKSAATPSSVNHISTRNN